MWLSKLATRQLFSICYVHCTESYHTGCKSQSTCYTSKTHTYNDDKDNKDMTYYGKDDVDGIMC